MGGGGGGSGGGGGGWGVRVDGNGEEKLLRKLKKKILWGVWLGRGQGDVNEEVKLCENSKKKIGGRGVGFGGGGVRVDGNGEVTIRAKK